MSGSSSGGSFGGFSGGDESSDRPSCYDFVERVHVSSPDPAVAVKVKINEVLDVTIQAGTTPILILETQSKEILGSVVPSKMARLLACIADEGVHYMAVILEINQGLIKVEIRAKV